MPRYDCRKDGRDPTAGHFPCAVRIIDPATGERIPNVFFVNTRPEGAEPALGRFIIGPAGEPLVSPHRKRRMVDDGRGGKRLEYYWDRLEVWEHARPWVALALDTGELIAKSEDAP